MQACVLTIGNEILAGDIHDTNFREICAFLRDAGIRVSRHASVPDEVEAIRDEVSRALEEGVELVLLTGGLGPTPDDLTREGIAAALGVDQVLYEDLAQELRQRFEAAGYAPVPENNFRQVTLPRGSHPLPNPLGSAPGFALKQRGSWVVAVPGVPQEMRRMVPKEVIPLLTRETDLVSPVVRVLRTQGIGESSLSEKIDGVLDSFAVEVGFYPKNPGVDIKLTCQARGKEARAILDEAERELCQVLGLLVYGAQGDSLSGCVGEMLRLRKWKLAVAESCTGGMLTSLVVQSPGASDYLERGIVAYSNQAKIELLGVPGELIEAHGAVSHEVARAMATGLRERTGADITLATTGIAGPTGGAEDKPVGLVYVAVAQEDMVESWELRSHGDRATVMRRSSVGALNRLRLVLSGA